MINLLKYIKKYKIERELQKIELIFRFRAVELGESYGIRGRASQL